MKTRTNNSKTTSLPLPRRRQFYNSGRLLSKRGKKILAVLPPSAHSPTGKTMLRRWSGARLGFTGGATTSGLLRESWGSTVRDGRVNTTGSSEKSSIANKKSHVFCLLLVPWLFVVFLWSLSFAAVFFVVFWSLSFVAVFFFVVFWSLAFVAVFVSLCFVHHMLFTVFWSLSLFLLSFVAVYWLLYCLLTSVLVLVHVDVDRVWLNTRWDTSWKTVYQINWYS